METNPVEIPLTMAFDINTIEFSEIEDSLVDMYNTRCHPNEPKFGKLQRECSIKYFNEIKHGSRNVTIRTLSGQCRKLIYTICHLTHLKYETWKENTLVDNEWRYWTVGVHIFRYTH